MRRDTVILCISSFWPVISSTLPDRSRDRVDVEEIGNLDLQDIEYVSPEPNIVSIDDLESIVKGEDARYSRRDFADIPRRGKGRVDSTAPATWESQPFVAPVDISTPQSGLKFNDFSVRGAPSLPVVGRSLPSPQSHRMFAGSIDSVRDGGVNRTTDPHAPAGFFARSRMYLRRLFRRRRRSRIIPDDTFTIPGVLDYYFGLIRRCSRGGDPVLIEETVADKSLLRTFMRVLVSWETSSVNVHREWNELLLVDRLLRLANMVDDNDPFAPEIVYTAMLVVSELSQRSFDGHDTSDLREVLAMERILDRNTFLWTLCNENFGKVSKHISDIHRKEWGSRPLFMGPDSENRSWAYLHFAGLAHAHRVCQNTASHDDGLALRSIYLKHRIQRYVWEGHLYNAYSGVAVVTELSDNRSVLKGLHELSSGEANQFRTGFRISDSGRTKRNQDQLRKEWFAKMVGALTHSGYLRADGVNSKLVRLSGRHNQWLDYFGLGRFFALSIVHHTPLGFGLADDILTLYMRDPAAKSDSNYINNFIDGFNSILPRDLFRDGIITLAEINQHLIGQEYIDPHELVSYFETPTFVNSVATFRDDSHACWEWFKAVIREELSQSQLRQFVNLISSDASPLPIGGLRDRIHPITLSVQYYLFPDNLPMQFRARPRTITVPLYHSKEIMKEKLLDLISEVDIGVA